MQGDTAREADKRLPPHLIGFAIGRARCGEMGNTLSVASLLQSDLAAEHAIDENKITERKSHPKCPPD